VISAQLLAKLKEKLRRSYGLDPRALSLMRIMLAAVLLLDLCIRVTSIAEFYTEQGAVPLKAVELIYWNPGYFSLYAYCDERWYAMLLFSLTAICYCMLLMGYKTRLFSILSWILLVSLQNRNTLILQGGDDELRLLLFWGIFLPWGNFYSFDARKERHSAENYFSVPAIGYLALLFSVYFFSGMLKHSSEWDSSEATAAWYAFNLDQMTWPPGKKLLEYPDLLRLISVSVRWFEMLSPLLLIIPFRTRLFRIIFIFLAALFHLTISLTLFVGLFYLVNLVALVGIFTPGMMNKFDNLFKRKERPISEVNHTWFNRLATNYYLHFAFNCLLIFFIALNLIWNLGTVSSGVAVSENFLRPAYFLRFDQNWCMFAPTVLKHDGWYILEATTEQGKKIDISRDGKPVDYSKPASVLEHIRDDRWRKFGENYMLEKNRFMRSYYCTYLLNDWNQTHSDEKITSLEVVYMKEVTPTPGGTFTITKENLCTCRK
jgi:uncharacterized membrane protein YphA (DoxX/SURF4 family)